MMDSYLLVVSGVSNPQKTFEVACGWNQNEFQTKEKFHMHVPSKPPNTAMYRYIREEYGGPIHLPRQGEDWNIHPKLQE